MTRRKFTAVRAAQITAHSEFSFGERTDKRREKSALATAQKPFVYINQNLHAGDLIDSFWVIYEFMFAYDKNQSETLFFHSNLCAHSFGCRRLNVALGLMTAEKIYDIKNAVHTIVNSLSLCLRLG